MVPAPGMSSAKLDLISFCHDPGSGALVFKNMVMSDSSQKHVRPTGTPGHAEHAEPQLAAAMQGMPLPANAQTLAIAQAVMPRWALTRVQLSQWFRLELVIQAMA